MAEAVIAVVGGLNMDLIFKTKRIPGVGESTDASTLFTLPGGKGANIAIAASRGSRVKPLTHPGENRGAHLDSRINVRVCMNGAIGDDEFGKKLKMPLEQSDIDVSGLITVPGGASGICVVLVDETRVDNRLIAYQGANMMWDLSDLEAIQSLGGQSIPQLVVATLGLQQEKAERVMRLAYRSNVDTLLNPSPAEPVTDSMYKYLTHLVVNETEASILSGDLMGGTKSPAAWAKMAHFFIERGVKNVVITLAEKGAYYATHTGDMDLVNAEQNVVVVDVTGAGDTFVGNYALEFVRQKQAGSWSIGTAVARACKAAARTIESFGAQETIPWVNEIDIHVAA